MSDGWLDFSPNILIPVLPRRGLKKLYVRECYKQIFLDMQLSEEGEFELFADRYLITGTPGIGKSLFLVFLLWHLVQRKKRVLYCWDSTNVYYDGQGNCWSLLQVPPYDFTDVGQPNRRFWREDLYCLYDLQNNKSPSALKDVSFQYCQFVLCSSPKRDSFGDYTKQVERDRRYYMPVWSEDEMRAIAPFYSESQDWEKLYMYLGGIPGTVFEMPLTVEGAAETLKSGSEKCSFSRVKAMTADPNEVIALNALDQVHRIIHIHSVAPYHQAFVKFATDAAAQHVCLAHTASIANYWNEMEGVDLPEDLCGTLVGKYLEIRVVKLLEKG